MHYVSAVMDSLTNVMSDQENKEQVSQLDARLHDAVERADISSIMSCLQRGAEVMFISYCC